MTVVRLHTNKRLSQVVKFGDVVYFSGQVPDDATADAATQTHQVLNKIDRLLAEVGSDKSRILTATIYLSDMENFAAMNATWETWMPEGIAPARATVQARLANPKYLVEIQVIAASPVRKQSLSEAVSS